MLGNAHSTRLIRTNDGYLGGVCGGIAQYFGVDPMWIRAGWLAMVSFFGTGILLYLAMWWVVPREDAQPVEPTIWVRESDGNHPPLQRTVIDRKLLGLCGGLARRYHLDPAILRIAALALFAFSAGFALLVYLVAAFFVPAPDTAPAHPVQL